MQRDRDGRENEGILGIDASNVRGGGGITHLVELLRAADPQRHGFGQVIVWAGSSTLAAIDGRPWLRKQDDPLLDRSLPVREYWKRFKLPKLAVAANCNVLFVPGGSDASGFRPMVTMSRNLLPFEWPEMRRYGLSWPTLKNALLHFTQSRTFRSADGLIFLTNYAQDIVMKSAGRGAARLAVIPHGIEDRFCRPPRPQRGIEDYSTDDPIKLLYVSIVEVYKHQWRVAEAVADLRRSGIPVTLDLVGPAYPPALKKLQQTLRRVDPEQAFIRYRGALPHDSLHELYATADISLFASSCENMPNILLEAMAGGLPIACSNRGPMPEILGDGAAYFDPEDPKDIVKALRVLIESPELRLANANAAFARSKKYSWSRCADETLGFIAQFRKART